MRTLKQIIFFAFSTATYSVFAQFTMGGMMGTMGVMGGLQGMGSQSYGIGMNAVNGMQGGMGMQGGRPQKMMRYTRVNLRPGSTTAGASTAGMTHVRVGANGPINPKPKPKPTSRELRRSLRLHKVVSGN